LSSRELVYPQGAFINWYIFPKCNQKLVYIPEVPLRTGIFLQRAAEYWYISARDSKVLVHMLMTKGLVFANGADENWYISPKGKWRTD
jgi:hypothetical protein